MLKKILLITTCTTISFCSAQSVMQSINCGSIIATQGIVSVGEIIVTPVSNNQSSSGILGVFTQNNLLSTKPLELQIGMTVFPNPTISKLHFETLENLAEQKVKVYNLQGKMMFETKIQEKSINLEMLEKGIYLIQFENKNYNSFKIIKQ